MFEHAAWFKPYVAGYYAFIHHHPDDRQYVMQHLEALLDYGKPFGGRKRFHKLQYA